MKTNLKMESVTIISGEVNEKTFDLEFKIKFHPYDVEKELGEMCLVGIEKAFGKAYDSIMTRYGESLD